MNNMKKKVLLLENINGTAKEKFENAGFAVEMLPHALSEKELIEKLQGVSVLGIRSTTEITKRVVSNAKTLKAVGAYCIGLNQIDIASCQKKSIGVFNAPYSNTRSVAELVIGEIIILGRNIMEKSKLMHEGVWDKSAQGSYEIRGKKLGIIGYGNIGKQVSVLADALGMNVYYYDIADQQAFGSAKQAKHLDEILEICDFITVHIDGRKENKHFIGKKEFQKMKKGAYFLNLSRGFVVDIVALKEVIMNGHLAGAAVDVFPDEPRRNGEFKNPLISLPNIILTPHIAGSTKEAQEHIAAYVTEKLIEYARMHK
jgi:D-3-phosphoglycerate dehydrogenase